jgi:hypothetical protein
MLASKDGTYASSIRGWMAKNAANAYNEYLWSGRVGVGAFTSWTCCPKKIVKEAQAAKKWPYSLLYKFELGHAYHNMYQKAAMNTPNLKWIKPYNIPDASIDSYNELGEKITITLRQHLDKCWPEIPVTTRHEGRVIISGRADDVENYCKRPTVLDIKTVNDKLNDFKNKTNEEMLQEKHRIQATIYGILMNDDKYYWPLEVKTVKLFYVCTHDDGQIGNPDSEREIYCDIKDEDYVKFHLISDETTRQILATDKNNDVECKYQFCAEHNL